MNKRYKSFKRKSCERSVKLILDTWTDGIAISRRKKWEIFSRDWKTRLQRAYILRNFKEISGLSTAITVNPIIPPCCSRENPGNFAARSCDLRLLETNPRLSRKCTCIYRWFYIQFSRCKIYFPTFSTRWQKVKKFPHFFAFHRQTLFLSSRENGFQKLQFAYATVT